MLKSQKENLTYLERSGKLKENNLRKELQRLIELQEDIKRRHKNAVRELSTGGDSFNKGCFGRKTNLFRESGDFSGNRETWEFFREI